MSTTDTTKKDEVQIIPATAPVVKRNGVDLTLSEQVFGKMHKLAGHKFWAPEVDVSNAEHVTWAVAESLSEICNKELRLVFGDIYSEALLDCTDTATGQLNLPEFLARLDSDWADFTAGVAKLKDLQAQVDLLSDQIAPIVTNEDFGQEDAEGNDTPACKALKDAMIVLNKRIVPLRKRIAGIKDVYKQRAANRVANEAASATKTPVPATVVQ